MLYLSSVLTVCTLGAVVYLQVRGHRPLVAYSRPVIQAHEVSVEFAWPPLAKPATRTAAGSSITAVADRGSGEASPPGTWLPVQFQRQLHDLVLDRLRESPDPFSARSIRAVGEGLAASGWFEGPPRIERRPGNRLVIDGQWRIPAAFVRWDGRDYLVAWDGRLLPPIYQPGQVNLRAIVNAPTPPPCGPNDRLDFSAPWPGGAVTEAVDLLALISGRAWYTQVRGVDLADFEKQRRLVLMTTFGTRVVWGGPVRRPLPGESTTQGKIEKLDLLFRDFRRIDAGRPAIDISLQSPPLEIDISASAAERLETTVSPPRRR